MKRECDLCGKKVSKFLEHLLLDHGIKTPEEYESKLSKKMEDEEKTKERQKQVNDLVEKLRSKEISADDYRWRVSLIREV